MTAETAKKAALLQAGKGQSSCGIVFFGGEPLLCRDVIYRLKLLPAGTWKMP